MLIDNEMNQSRFPLKAMILMNNNLPVTPDNLKILSNLWDIHGNYFPQEIPRIIELIKKRGE